MLLHFPYIQYTTDTNNFVYDSFHQVKIPKSLKNIMNFPCNYDILLFIIATLTKGVYSGYY